MVRYILHGIRCLSFVIAGVLAPAFASAADGAVSGALETPDRFLPTPPPSKGNFGNDVVYYIVVDRFIDGEPGNNVPLFAFPDEPHLSEVERAERAMNRQVLPMTYDSTRKCMGMYFGGDLEGVRQKLPYLADLGVTQIILSPIMDNANGFLTMSGDTYLRNKTEQMNTQGAYAQIVTAYHGYYTLDWWRLDEHFQNPADFPHDPLGAFRRLLNDANALGIGIMLDITLNQTSPNFDTFVHGGSVFANGQLVARFDLEEAERGLDPFYHRYFWIDFTNPSQSDIENGVLPGGMPDLNQSNPEVSRYLIEAALFWLNFSRDEGAGISGFRVDAVKHVSTDFWLQFENAIMSSSPDAILLGE